MNLDLLADNLTNPAFLFFALGLLSVQLKSDLTIPQNSSKFISLYLLFSIGFKGGQELAHSEFSMEIVWGILFGLFIAGVIPIFAFYMLRRKLGVENSGAIAAAYGSVSAVTFVTAVSYLEILEVHFSGYMVAVMAFMEAPAIIVGVLLVRLFSPLPSQSVGMKDTIKHALTNGSVILILGSLVIGSLASDAQAEGIKPFTTDIFKGFLAIFLLDMGISSGKKIKDFLTTGWTTTSFAILMPLFNGLWVSWLSQYISTEPGDRFMFAILAASASYIAVPAAMKIAVPKANPGIFLPMALAITFPLNITIGLPLYYWAVTTF
ncbi:sodium-dependent bicarbonate transport family permease [Lunatimonas salinarum]|uniref:sodium-dependent bicarbonate transport family permease n=1 Tax=Lunatimonas salinarum TaxID=1774590 RepID=UPI001AE09AEC|nr:sodium-dependent bicarbonate transport family permease [Lunatimonas salinarum]